MSLLDTAHEIWAAAQLLPAEGIVDGVGRVESLLSQCRKEARKEALLEAANEIGSLQGQEIHDTMTFQRCAERLRCMAESTMEGEKSE